MTSASGPAKTIPSRSQSSAKAGCSATKPQPTHAASAPRLDERALEALVVEVGAELGAVGAVDHRRAEAVALVGLADEQRVALLLGVEGDDADRLVALLVELADGVDGAHRRLAAVDDGEAREGGSCRGHASLV